MKKLLLPIAILTIVFIIYVSLTSKKREVAIIHPNGQAFAGTAKCAQCHADIAKNFLTTGHHLTTQPADENSIKGPLTEPDNIFWFNQTDKVVLAKAKGHVYQVGFSSGKWMDSLRVDIAIGSGTRGQSYLRWDGSNLLQLPLSYFASDHKWISNPGSRTDKVIANRNIDASCLNCHATYFKTNYLMSGASEFDPKEIIYGVECERCHGPGASHISAMVSGSSDKKIINAKYLKRNLQLDACGQCHSSQQRKSLKLPFTFFPGDSMVMNTIQTSKVDTSAEAEVHGNQYGMLAASKCFLESNSLTCGSCHDPHKKERGDLKLFSSRCISCHQQNHEKQCKLGSKMSSMLSENCIDCHMPLRTSKKIAFRSSGTDKKSYEIARTHFISIYPEQAKKILAALEKNISR
jgi:hypothetical protein